MVRYKPASSAKEPSYKMDISLVASCRYYTYNLVNNISVGAPLLLAKKRRWGDKFLCSCVFPDGANDCSMISLYF